MESSARPVFKSSKQLDAILSFNFFESTGAWQHVEQSRVQPYNEMQVWDAGNESSIKFDWKAESQRYNAPPRTVATMTENAAT